MRPQYQTIFSRIILECSKTSFDLFYLSENKGSPATFANAKQYTFLTYDTREQLSYSPSNFSSSLVCL